MLKIILVLFSLAMVGTAAHADNDVVCGEVKLALRPLKYCAYDPLRLGLRPGSEVNVIYYFHGLGGGADDLFSPDGKNILRGLQATFGAKQPIYVGLSTGNEGVIGQDAADIAVNGIPAVEARIAPGKNVRRLGMGGSMGGHNVMRLAAEKPELFRSVAALCPALGTFNGYDPADVAAYEQRNAKYLNRDFFEKALVAYKKSLTTEAMWKDNNPFKFLASGAYDTLPIFLSVGREDTVGFIEGVREFANRSSTRPAMQLEVHEVTGPHCVFDVPSFLRFMVRNS